MSTARTDDKKSAAAGGQQAQPFLNSTRVISAKWRVRSNTLIDDLLWPTSAVTHAISAVAQGDLLQTVRLDVDGRRLKGEFLRSANIVNIR
jgi:hypothetical protein